MNLHLFMKYADKLDAKFDDGLDISYYDTYIPSIKIIYDPTVNYDELCNLLPTEWIEYRDIGKLKIIIKKFTEDSDEYKQAIQVLNTPIMIEKQKKIYELLSKK